MVKNLEGAITSGALERDPFPARLTEFWEQRQPGEMFEEIGTMKKE